MPRLPQKLVTLVVAVIVVGGLALVASSRGSTAATPTPATPAPDMAVQSWQAFQAHLASSLPGLETDMSAVASAGTAGYITAAGPADDAVRADAIREVAWLQANPAAPCYAAIHDDYLAANQTLETAMSDAISGDYTTANALIDQFNSSLANLANDSATTAC
jgi:hypothetical protein